VISTKKEFSLSEKRINPIIWTVETIGRVIREDKERK
jgi:hypothetical protein